MNREVSGGRVIALEEVGHLDAYVVVAAPVAEGDVTDNQAVIGIDVINNDTTPPQVLGTAVIPAAHEPLLVSTIGHAGAVPVHLQRSCIETACDSSPLLGQRLRLGAVPAATGVALDRPASGQEVLVLDEPPKPLHREARCFGTMPTLRKSWS